MCKDNACFLSILYHGASSFFLRDHKHSDRISDNQCISKFLPYDIYGCNYHLCILYSITVIKYLIFFIGFRTLNYIRCVIITYIYFIF